MGLKKVHHRRLRRLWLISAKGSTHLVFRPWSFLIFCLISKNVFHGSVHFDACGRAAYHRGMPPHYGGMPILSPSWTKIQGPRVKLSRLKLGVHWPGGGQGVHNTWHPLPPGTTALQPVQVRPCCRLPRLFPPVWSRSRSALNPSEPILHPDPPHHADHQVQSADRRRCIEIGGDYSQLLSCLYGDKKTRATWMGLRSGQAGLLSIPHTGRMAEKKSGPSKIPNFGPISWWTSNCLHYQHKYEIIVIIGIVGQTFFFWLY